MDLEKPGDFIVFTKDIFTNNYFDKENDLAFKVRITNIPQYGFLVFDNKVLNKSGYEFKISEVNKLRYYRVSPLEYTENITFQTSDNNINNLFSNMATFTINVNAYVNLPPDQIGDNEITAENGEIIVFTVEDFTTNTTPPYDDPEGDPPYKLKILSLPADGSKLILDGDIVVLNQEILFSDIEAGLLTIEQSPNLAAHSIDFDFTISDVGSEQFYTP
jgi:hypothetical protein